MILRKFQTISGPTLVDSLYGAKALSDAAARGEHKELELDLSDLVWAEPFAFAQLVAYVEAACRRGHAVSLRLPSLEATDEESPILRNRRPRRDSRGRELQRQVARSVRDRRRTRLFLDARGLLDSLLCQHLPAGSQPRKDEERLALDEGDRSSSASPQNHGTWRAIDAVPFRWVNLGDTADLRETTEKLWKPLSNLSSSGAVEEVVGELVTNVYEHSNYHPESETTLDLPDLRLPTTALFGALLEEHRPGTEGGRLRLIVADGGVGIPDTLRHAFRSAYGAPGTDNEILDWAFSDSSTRKIASADRGSTSGLGQVRRLVTSSGGSIRALSNGGLVSLGLESWIREYSSNFTPRFGTALEVSWPVATLRPRPTGTLPSTQRSSRPGQLGSHKSQKLARELFPYAEISESFDLYTCPQLGPRRSLIQDIKRIPDTGRPLIVLPDASIREVVAERLRATVAAGDLTRSAPLLVADATKLTLLEAANDSGETAYDQWSAELWEVFHREVGEHVTSAIQRSLAETAGSERLTWSLSLVGRWVEPSELLGTDRSFEIVLSWYLASLIAQLTGADGRHELVVTDQEMLPTTESIAHWLGRGATHVVDLRSPMDPDFTIFRAGYDRGQTHVITSVLNQGAAVLPTVRGLQKAGQNIGTVVAIVDGRGPEAEDFTVNGLNLEPVSICQMDLNATPERVKVVREEATEQLAKALRRHRSNRFFSSVAATPAALQLGHFHSASHTWTSCIINPNQIVDPGTVIGAFIASSMASEISDRCRDLPTCPLLISPSGSGGIAAMALAEAVLTRCADSLPNPSELLRPDQLESRDVQGHIVALVDWGTVTWTSMFAEAGALTPKDPHEILLLSGVGRRPMNESIPYEFTTAGARESGAKPTVRPIAIGKLPMDPRAGIGCPLCEVHSDLLEIQNGSFRIRASARSALLRVRGPYGQVRIQTEDAFGDVLSEAEARSFLVVRQLIIDAMGSPDLAYGLMRQIQAAETVLLQTEIDAICRSFILNPQLVSCRPFSVPRFRQALSVLAERQVLQSPIAGGQWLTLLRVVSKPDFIRVFDAVFDELDSTAQTDGLACSLTMLKRSYHQGDPLSDQLRLLLHSLAKRNMRDEVREQLAEVQSIALDAQTERIADSDLAPDEMWREVHQRFDRLFTHVDIEGRCSHLLAILWNIDKQLDLDLVASTSAADWEILRQFIVDELVPWVRVATESLEQSSSHDSAPYSLAATDLLYDISTIDDFFARVALGTADATFLKRVVEASNRLGNALELKDPTIQWCLSVPSNIDSVAERVAFESQYWRGTTEVRLVFGFGGGDQLLIPDGDLTMLLEHLVANAGEHATSTEHWLEVEYQSLLDQRLGRLMAISYGTTPWDPESELSGGLSGGQFGGLISRLGGSLEVVHPVDLPGSATFGLTIDLPLYALPQNLERIRSKSRRP